MFWHQSRMTCRLGDAVLDEHALGLGHGQEELVEALFVVLAQRAQLALGAVLERDFLGILLEFDIRVT